jgi:hypothetical protein
LFVEPLESRVLLSGTNLTDLAGKVDDFGTGKTRSDCGNAVAIDENAPLGPGEMKILRD